MRRERREGRDERGEMRDKREETREKSVYGEIDEDEVNGVRCMGARTGRDRPIGWRS